MGNASINVKTVTIIEGITLNLTLEQATAMLALGRCVQGDNDDSFRKEINEINEQLENIGLVADKFDHLTSGFVTMADVTSYDRDRLDEVRHQLIARNTGDLTKISDWQIDDGIRNGNKIAAIKRLRELSARMVDGNNVFAGLKEAKDEIDRRFEIHKSQTQRW